MFSYLQSLVMILLAGLRVSVSVKCTALSASTPCVCSLSEGAHGLVDISPLFAQGNLSAFDSNRHWEFFLDPCHSLQCIMPCLDGPCAVCQQSAKSSNFGFSVGSQNSVQYSLNNYDFDTNRFTLNITYKMGSGNRLSKIGFVYDPTVSQPELVWESEHPLRTYHFHIVTNGPGVLIPSNASAPSNTSGPYPIQRSACDRGTDSVLQKTGLMELSAKAINLNHTWAKGEYLFEYFVGVCAPPISTPLSGCYVVQKTTQPSGDISFQCLGGSVDNQVTDTQKKGWMLLSYTDGNRDAISCDGEVRRIKIFFFCKRGAGSGRPLFVVQNPLQDDCFYQFNWPTDILCEPSNSTQPSPTQSSQPISMETALLVGLAVACLLLLALLLIVVMATMCYICCTKSSSAPLLKNYQRMGEPSGAGVIVFD